MIQFFKITSWDRFFLLLFLFGLMQAPFLVFGQNMLTPELLWIRLGERLSDGWRLYAQVSDETGPLAAMVYALLARIQLADFQTMRYLASGLILIQAFWLNQTINRYQLLNERSYHVAFFYLIFSHLGPDSVSLSPALLASTFLLGVWGRLFKIIKSGPSSDDAVFVGLSLGLGILCYQPIILFLLPIFLSALFFMGLRLNQYFQIAVAALLPSAIIYAFFLVGGGVDDFWTCFMAPFRVGFLLSWVGWEINLGLGGLLALISIIGWFSANQHVKSNFQQIGITVFFFGLAVGLLLIFPGTIQTTYQLFFLVPFASFFMAQWMQNTRSRLAQEIIFYLVLILVLGSFYGMANPGFGRQIFGHNLFCKEPPRGFKANFANQPLLLLSNDFEYYRYNPPATRFFKFYLSGIRPKDAQTIEGLIYWYQCLAENPPKLIYDPNGLIPPLAVRIPEVSHRYASSFYPSLYVAHGSRFGKTK